MKYFLRKNEEEFPPFSLQDLKQFNKDNDLSDFHYWHNGMSDWETFKGSKLQKIIEKRSSAAPMLFILGVLIFIICIFFVMESVSDNDSYYRSDSEAVVVESDYEDVVVESDYEDVVVEVDDNSQIKNINESSANSEKPKKKLTNDDTEDQRLKDFFAGKKNSSYDDVNYEPVKTLKYVYIVFDVSIPKELGYNEGIYDSSLGINIKGTYYPIYQDSQLISDVLEMENYSEDLKHRLFDSFESQNIEPSGLPSLSVSNSQGIFQYRTKVLKRNIFVFDSYSEASKHRRKKL